MDLLVSFIIPAYNASSYITECLNSITRTHMPTDKYEVIIVNDGSKDDTVKVIEQNFLPIYNNIKVISQANAGVSVARNTGLKSAKGKWICFVDADDFIVSDNFTLFESMLNKDNIDLIQGIYIDTHEAARKQFKTLSASDLVVDVNDKPISCYNPKKCGAVGSLYNRQFLCDKGIEFPVGIKVAEDLYFTLQCFLMASKCLCTNIVHYYYRINDTSCMTTMTKPKLMDSGDILGRIYKLSLQYTDSADFIVQEVILHHLKINLWYISHYKSLFAQRKEILGKLQSGLKGIVFAGSIQNRVFTFLFHNALNAYVTARFNSSKRLYD